MTSVKMNSVRMTGAKIKCTKSIGANVVCLKIISITTSSTKLTSLNTNGVKVTVDKATCAKRCARISVKYPAPKYSTRRVAKQPAPINKH